MQFKSTIVLSDKDLADWINQFLGKEDDCVVDKIESVIPATQFDQGNVLHGVAVTFTKKMA